MPDIYGQTGDLYGAPGGTYGSLTGTPAQAIAWRNFDGSITGSSADEGSTTT